MQINYFEKYFTKDDVLWDIGSHHGHYSIFAASITDGPNQVFSFEPDSVARQIQRKNIEINRYTQRIKVYDEAVSHINGQVLFKQLMGNSNSSIVNDVSEDSGQIISIASITLDKLTEMLPLPTYVKIDTEGAEINILKSANHLLSNKSIKFICELHPFAWSEYRVNFSMLLEILEKSGRSIFLLDNKRSKKELPYYGTIIF